METAADKMAHADQEPLTASEERAAKAARIRAALRQLAHLRISTEEYLREKHAELAREEPSEGHGGEEASRWQRNRSGWGLWAAVG
jgi:hypothetical protein